MSSATFARSPTASFARCTAAETISSTVLPMRFNFSPFAPKVFV